MGLSLRLILSLDMLLMLEKNILILVPMVILSCHISYEVNFKVDCESSLTGE